MKKERLIDRLEKIRIEKDLSLEKFARELNISYQTYYRWARYNYPMSEMGKAVAENYIAKNK